MPPKKKPFARGFARIKALCEKQAATEALSQLGSAIQLVLAKEGPELRTELVQAVFLDSGTLHPKFLGKFLNHKKFFSRRVVPLLIAAASLAVLSRLLRRAEKHLEPGSDALKLSRALRLVAELIG